MKTLLMIIALVLLAGLGLLIWRGSRSSAPAESNVARFNETSRGPSFEVRVVMPRMGLPLGGILPDWVVRKLDATPREMGFDHTSQGVQVGTVSHDRLELTADGWDLSIKTDDKGLITSETRLVFDLALGGRHLKLKCQPGDPRVGQLHTTTRPGSSELSGRFVLELAKCTNAESRKKTNWPPAPLTISGSFAGLAPR
ncbi:MAG TPA: hypothetical protein VJU86_10530 [Pyrinomonadaceae bacterium]|nr:hypothetical protein [Pyrinomonadaceae bacterium]